MTPWLDDGDVRLYHGDCLEVLRQVPDRSVHMCATSPPFYGLRDYGTDRQIGLEETPDEWVERLVSVFRECRRVLRDDGTCWIEIGDSFSSNNGKGGTQHAHHAHRTSHPSHNPSSTSDVGDPPLHLIRHKPKDLLGQPWLLAFALRADGWYLRSEIIWARPNPMPESVTDRPTKSHSTVFLLSKRPRYFYDADAIREPPSVWAGEQLGIVRGRKVRAEAMGRAPSGNEHPDNHGSDAPSPANGANARSVWTIPTEPTPFAHFATWPQALVRRMILAGTSERGCCPECGAPWVRDTHTPTPPEHVYTNAKGVNTGGRDLRQGGGGSIRHSVKGEGKGHGQKLQAWRDQNPTVTLGWSPSCAHYAYGDVTDEWDGPAPIPCTVLDPFAGSATTMLVARNHGRHAIGIELNESYLEIAARRLQQLSLLA